MSLTSYRAALPHVNAGLLLAPALQAVYRHRSLKDKQIVTKLSSVGRFAFWIFASALCVQR